MKFPPMIETQRIRSVSSLFPTRLDWPALKFPRGAGQGLHLNKSFVKLYTDRMESLSPEDRRCSWYHAWPLTHSEYLFRLIHRLLERHLGDKPQHSILEVGCGSGEFCKTLNERGYRAFGIDRSHLALKQARENAPAVEFERASFYESFRELFVQQFDAIVFLHAVEQLQSPQRFINRVLEALVPGGCLVISARFQGHLTSLTNALGSHTGEADLLQQVDDFIEDDDPITLGQLLEESGLEVVEFQGADQLPTQWRSQLFVARKPLPVTANSLPVEYN